MRSLFNLIIKQILNSLFLRDGNNNYVSNSKKKLNYLNVSPLEYGYLGTIFDCILQVAITVIEIPTQTAPTPNPKIMVSQYIFPGIKIVDQCSRCLATCLLS